MEKSEKKEIQGKFRRISALYNMETKDWANLFGLSEKSFNTTTKRWERKKIVIKLFDLFRPG